MGATRKELMEAEVVRLKENDAGLHRDWKRIPYLFGLIVLAAPAQWLFGPAAGLGAVLCVPALVLTAVYLVGVRRQENRRQIAELETLLKKTP